MFPEHMAELFHETYERLAPSYGYETRPESRKPWEELPENLRELMTAVCAELASAYEEDLEQRKYR